MQIGHIIKSTRWFFMKKFLLMLLILFICGIISADLCIEELINSKVILDIGVYQGYANAKLAFKDVFWNIFYERIKLIAIMILLCFTPLRDKISFLFISIFSFVWGFFFMSCIAELGLTGVVVGIVSVFPHGIFYAGILFLFLQSSTHHSYHQRSRTAFNVVTYIVIFLMFLTGCVLESLMGTHFIPWVIRLGLV